MDILATISFFKIDRRCGLIAWIAIILGQEESLSTTTLSTLFFDIKAETSAAAVDHDLNLSRWMYDSYLNCYFRLPNISYTISIESTEVCDFFYSAAGKLYSQQ